MASLLHTIASSNGQAIYNAAESIAKSIDYDVDQAYSIAYEIGLMENYNLLADTLKSLSNGEFQNCEYDLNLVFQPTVIDLKGLDLFAFAYALFTDCNMHTLARKLSDFVMSLSV